MGQSDLAGFRTGETDDANAAASGWSGDGDDGVVKIHDEIVAGVGQNLQRRGRGEPPQRTQRKPNLGNRLPHRSSCRLVVLGIDDQAAAAAFALTLGVQVGLIAQGQMHDAAFAR